VPFRVRTVRTECLDWMLVFGRHLERILRLSTRSTTTTEGRTEVFSSKRRSRGSTRFPVRPMARGFEGTTSWAG